MNNIILSQKNTFIYIEYCRVSTVDGQLCFNKSQNGEVKYYTIPYGNLAVLILGSGTSITQQATRLIAKEKMLLAFSSGNMGNLYLTSQSEYRNPMFLQKWYLLWMNDNTRLIAAKQVFKKRFENNVLFWEKLNNRLFKNNKELSFNVEELKLLNNKTLEKIIEAKNTQELLGFEGNYVKDIYKILAKTFNLNFSRDHQNENDVNVFLNKSNYLSYGIATSVLWTLGIPSSLALFHGKTRKGGLVFDIADTIKDGITLPISFLCFYNKASITDLRKIVLETFEDFNILSNLFITIREVLENFDPKLNDDFFNYESEDL